MSVTTRPRTASPRNSSRSFVTSWSCSNAKERCVSAAVRIWGSWNVTPRASSSADGCEPPTRCGLTSALDLHGSATRVVAAVRAHAVRDLRLMALRALCVCGRLGLPVRPALGPAAVALSTLRYRHRSSLSSGSVVLAERVERVPAGIDRVIARALAEVAVATTPRAEPQAVRTAERREGELEHDRVPDDGLGVERQVRLERVVVLRTRLANDHLVHVDSEIAVELLQAAGAPEARAPADRAGDVDPLHDALERQLGGDGPVVRHGGELGRRGGRGRSQLVATGLHLVDRPGEGAVRADHLLEDPLQRGLELRELRVDVVLGFELQAPRILAGLPNDPVGLLLRALDDRFARRQPELLGSPLLDHG